MSRADGILPQAVVAGAPKAMASNPFVGPRPYATDEAFLFHGRAQETKELAAKILSYPLTILRGPSGTGKTSLLRAGLLPELERRRERDGGFKVALLREWAGSALAPDPIAHALAVWLGEAAGDRNALEVASQAVQLHGPLLLILDQFEEILRSGQSAGRSAAAGVAALHKSGLSLQLVVSLREEHVHQLGLLESSAGGLYKWSYFLRPMRRRAVEEAIPQAATQASTDLRTEALARVLDWTQSGEDGRSPGTRDVDLIATQAILFQLWERSPKGHGTVRIDLPLVDAYSQERSGQAVTRRALTDWVERAVRTPPMRVPSPPPGWGASQEELDGLVYTLATRMGKHLSSGGYKLLLSKADLARRVLGQGLPLTHAPAGTDFAAFLESIPEELFSGPARRLNWTEREFGTRLGLAYDDLLARFGEGNILKFSHHPLRGETVELLHDGLGDALKAWAESEEKSLPAATFAPSALSGEPITPRPADLERIRIIQGIVWKGCAIGADTDGERSRLSDLEFKDAELRGCVFLDCDLENVVFRNCNLTAIFFRKCRLGKPGAPVRFVNCEGDGLWVSGGTVGDLTFDDYPVDQMTFHGVMVEGQVSFLRGSYIASSVFSELKAANAPPFRYDSDCGGEYNSWDEASEALLGDHGWSKSGKFVRLQLRRPS